MRMRRILLYILLYASILALFFTLEPVFAGSLLFLTFFIALDMFIDSVLTGKQPAIERRRDDEELALLRSLERK